MNTKVDMRFNVIDAEWLSERIRLKLLDTVSVHIDAHKTAARYNKMRLCPASIDIWCSLSVILRICGEIAPLQAPGPPFDPVPRVSVSPQEKNRINGDGELVVSSTRTRTQK